MNLTLQCSRGKLQANQSGFRVFSDRLPVLSMENLKTR